MRKRVFAMVLVAALCVSLLPTTAFAEEGEYAAEATEEAAETDTQTVDIEIAGDNSATFVVQDVDEVTDEDSIVEEPGEAPGESEDVADEEAAEEEAEPEEIVYEKKDGSIRVEVTAPADALPEGAELSVQRYEKNSNEYRDAAEAIGFEEDQGTDMAAVDISFLLDGKEVEPSEPVKVSIDVSDILPEDTDASTLEVQHLVEKADDTVKPVVVANDSEETEGTIDEKKATAEFEVESFSTFTVTWTWSAGGMGGGTSVSISVTAYLDGVEIDGIEDVDFTSENDELDFYTLLSEVGYGTSDYTFSYAIVNQTYGSQENPVVAIEIDQGTGGPTSSTNFLLVYADGTTGTISTTNANVSVYYLTPDFSVSIDVVDEDEATEAWALQAVLSHAGSYDSISYDWTVKDADGSDSQYAKVTNTDNTGRAYISWVEGVPDNTEVTVTVTVTITLEDGSTKTATADYKLEYGDETIDLIMTYGPDKTALPEGVTVTLTSASGDHVYSGETSVDDNGVCWVHDLEIEPGIYTVEAEYTTTDGSTYRFAESVAFPDAGNYYINLYYYDPDIITSVPNRSNWEHIDIKLSVGTTSNSVSGTVSVDITEAQIVGSEGNVKYTAKNTEENDNQSITRNDNEFQLLFYTGEDTTGSYTHSISFDTSDTIYITYVISIDGVEQSPVTIAIDSSTVYDRGTTYPADGQRAYKLYNYLYGTEYNSDAQLIADGITEIDISGMSMMLVAAILCDSSAVTGAGQVEAASSQGNQWGMDFAFSIEAFNQLAASWAFDIQKTYENASMTAGDFVFYLYSASVDEDGVWSTSTDDLQSTLSNQTAGMDWDGNSHDTMELYSISYSDEDIANGATYYYILYEEPDTVTSASGATITFDSTIFGVMVQVGTFAEEPYVIATYYRLEQNEDGTYTIAETYTTGEGEDGKITFDDDDYATFEFTNVYQDTMEISGEKIWDDGDNVDNTRPESITINLYQDGELYASVIVTAEDNWEWKFEDLPIYNGVTEYIYTIDEVSVDGYVTETEVDENGTYIITNTYEPTPEFEPEKDVDADGDGIYEDSGMGVQVGDTLTYIINYENPYNEGATITITDELDKGLDYVEGSASDNGSYDENTRTITWKIDVAALDSGNVTFQATVNENAIVERYEVENTAHVILEVGDDPATVVEKDTNPVYNPVPDKDVDIHGDETYGDSGLTVNVGDTLTYIIYYENPDDDPATVTITDVLDDGLTYESSNPEAAESTNEDGHTVLTWTIEGVEAHTNGSVTFTATVNDNALVKYEVDNTAAVQVGDHPSQDTKTVYNPLVPENPSKDVDANADGEYGDNGMGVKVGDTLTYEIKYLNDTGETVFVTITDEVDEGLDFKSADNGGTYDEDERLITWEIGEVEAGKEVTVTFTATVNETALVRNEIDNTATVWVSDDPEVKGEELPTNTVYNPVPDKDVDADGDGVYEDSGMQVNVGDTLVYKIDYENPDDEAATVTITDEVDVGLDYVSSTDDGSYDESSRMITWVIENVEPHTNGSVYFTATVNETALVKYEVDNTATVQVGEHDAQQTKTVYNPLVPENPSKDVDADGNGEYGDNGMGVKVGDTLTYEIKYLNDTGETVIVTITDEVDEGLDFKSADNGGTYDEDERLITWEIGEVEPGEEITVTFTATVNETALVRNEVDNTATVLVRDDPEVEAEELPTNTVYNPVPDKDVDADGDGVYEDSGMEVNVGDTLVYKIDYENPDDEAATVTITDEVDVGLDYVSSTDDGSYDESNRMITWVIENVEPHTNGSVYFTATVNETALEASVVENTATVQVGNHAEQQTKTVYNPLEPAKDVDIHNDETYGDSGLGVKVGDTLTYIVSYFNGNDTDATITITDVLDEGLDFVSASDEGAYDKDSRTITWTLNVAGHEGGNVTFQATVNETALIRNEVDNTANVSVQVGDNPAIAVDTNTVYNPVPHKDVEIHEDDDTFGDSGLLVRVGDTLTYKIDYENPDDEAATVTITDVLDIGLDFVEASDGGTYDEDSRTITWVIPDVEAHDNGSVTFDAVVNESAKEKDLVENTATVQVGNYPEQETNEVENPLGPKKDVEIHKDDDTFGDDGLSTKVGDTLTYKIEYFNGNDEPATVKITDVLDEGLDFVEASDGGTYDEESRTITWVIEDVEAHMDGFVTFTATVNEKAMDKNEVDNTATVKVGDNEEQETNTVVNPVYREYFPIDEEIVPDESDPSTWVKEESVNEYNGIELEMSTNLPIIIPEDLASGQFMMYFHNILVSELKLDEDTTDFTVYIGDQLISEDYYEILFDENTDDDCNFHVNVDLTALYNDGKVTDDMLDGNTVIRIFFYADLEGTGLNGSYTSTVWYDVYDGENWEYTSNEDVVEVYTYEVEIAKIDGETGDPLAGAEFGIFYDEDCKEPVYRRVGQGYDADEKYPYTVISGEDGVAMFYGLAEGTYYVKELNAPMGYVLSDEIIEVKLSADTVDDDHIYHYGEFENTPSEPDEPQNPKKFVDTDGDGEFTDNHLMVNVGDEVTYRIAYYNYYDEPVTVTVKDGKLDYALDFVSATDDGEYDESTRTITWTIEDVPAFTMGYVEFTATVNDIALLEDEITNTASVQIGNDDFVDTNTVENPTPDSEGEGNPTTGNPKTGTGSPKTGDTNNIALWLVLMLAAMVGVFTALRLRKRS